MSTQTLPHKMGKCEIVGDPMSLLRKIVKKLVDFWQEQRERDLRILMLWSLADTVRFFTGAPMRRVSQITPQLHLGDQYDRRGWPILAARGVTAVVNMRTEFDDSHAGIAPKRYLHLPTINNESPTLIHLRRGAAFIAAEIARGGGVYVHCRSGVQRAPTMVAAYLVSTGLTPTQAWERIRAGRPFVCPTLEQIDLVERFAEQGREGVWGDIPDFAYEPNDPICNPSGSLSKAVQ